MYTTIDLQRGALTCSELGRTFTLNLEPLGKGSPDIANLDPAVFFILSSIISSIFSVNSMIQYTAMDSNDTPIYHHILSNNIVVFDQLFHGSVSRELIYDKSSLSTSS